MEIYFNMFKIRFTVLEELLHKNRIEVGSEVNIFINLENILTYLTTPKVDEYLRVKSESKVYELIACMINMASHYRLFFSKFGVRSKVYLYYQHPFNCVPKNVCINTDYRTYYRYKFDKNVTKYIISDTLDAATPLAKIILEYVNGVYLIGSGQIENSLIPMMVPKKKGSTNFIVTTSLYDFQYVNQGFNILYPKQDKSKLLTSNNVMGFIYAKNDISGELVSPNTLPFILSIVGDRMRNVYGIKGIGLKRSIQLIRKAMDMGIITQNTTSIDLFLNGVKSMFRDDIRNNYRCVDLISQYNELSKIDRMLVADQLVDKFDNVALKELNDKYFVEYPLQLIELTGNPKGTRVTF